MDEITAITAQTKNKKRVNIFVDGEYRYSLDKMSVFSFGLKVGLSVNKGKFDEIIRDSEEKSAFDSGVKYLCIRRRTELEIIKYLKNKEFSSGTIENTVKKLKEYGYVNDREFCRAYIVTYRQKYGNRKLSFELTKLGVDQEIIAEFIEDEDNNEEIAAEAAAEKYVRTHSKQITFVKLATFLYGKGFSGEIAKRIAAKYTGTLED